MDRLTCREVDEALAAYAAAALDETEHAATAAHLAECRNHDAELRALRDTFAAVASGVALVQPSDALRSSLLEAFDRETAGASAATVPEPIRREAPPRASKGVPAWFGYALAAAMLVVAIGLGAWGASRGGGSDVVTYATADTIGSLELTYFTDRDLGVLDVQLQAAGGSSVYQAWRIDTDGSAASLGVLPAAEGRFVLQGSLSGASSVALSVEPAGGSEAPTSTPLLVTALN